MHWGATGCTYCAEAAWCLSDGIPLCVLCAELEIDRLEAIALYPDMRETLPAIGDR